MNLVALPIAIGNVPITSGSRVPVCPTFFVFSNFLICLTQSCEVHPLSLLITSKKASL